MNIGKTLKGLIGKRSDAKDNLKGEVRTAMTQYHSAKKYWSNFFDRGAESVEFYGGNQWNADDLGKMQSNNRPVVTINMIAPLVRQVTGMRTNERLQPRVIPERDGTIDMAYVYTHLVYFILKKNNYQATNYRVQEDQVVTGRGYWEVDVSFENDPRGELVLNYVRWNEVIPDPTSDHPYFDDARYVIRAKLMTKDAIERHYGNVEGSLIAEEPEGMNWYDDDDIRDKNIHDDYVDSSGMYLVVERLTLERKKKWMMTDGQNWNEYDQEKTKDELSGYGPDVRQISKTQKTLMKTVFIPGAAGDRPIYEGKCRLQVGSYNIIPCTCYNAGNKLMGIVEDLKDEQKRMNKSFAQIIEVLGYSSKGFWLLPRGAGITEEQWRMNSTRPGGGIWYDGDKEPKHINPASLPQGYGELFKQSLPNMQNISGVTPARMGTSEYSGESGVKFAQKLQQAREQLAIIDKRFIDGFNRVVKIMMKAIPTIYTEEFAFQAMEGNDEVKDIKVNVQTINGIFNDLANDPGEYDVSVEQSEETSSIRQSHNLELATMMSQVGPEFAAFFAAEWIRGSDAIDKEEKARKLELLSGQLMQMRAMELQLSAMQQQQKGQAANNKNEVEQQQQGREDQQLALEAKRLQLEGLKAAHQMKRENSETDMKNLEKAMAITRGPNANQNG